MALAAPASADAAVCMYLPPPPKVSKAERFLRQTIEQRKFWTLPHGRAYVRRVNADPANHRRGYGILDLPLTAREAAYFHRRRRLVESRGFRRLDAYMRRHRDVFGALSIEDDFPRPYLQLRVTRDLERHGAAIRRLYPYRFKLKRVPYSERELRRIQDAIDFDALSARDIHPISSGTADDAVELEVATTREDAAAVVRDLYGPAVRLIVRGPTWTFLECVGPESFEVAADGRTLTVHFGESGSIDPSHVEVVETDYGVDLGVVIETPYIQTADLVHYELTVTLAKPLGDRPVRSIEYGYRVRRGRPGRG